MTQTIHQYKIPIETATGTIPPQVYPDSRGIEWVTAPYEFTDTLTFQGYYRGTSAAGMELVGTNGARYCITVSEMFKLLQKAVITRGRVSGNWKVIKQGASYSLSYKGE